ncbi:MAG: HAD-IIA family hydrolase [Anaerolineae bacterium]|nr:HAD-IIA family hydrolase [Anaerolineae bacterium]
MTLANISGVVMDMDGVLWRGDVQLPGVHEWFSLLRTRAIPFALATNNSTKTPTDYVDKLAHFGIDGVKPHQIITSSTTTVDYLRKHYPAGTKVYVVGGDGLRTLLVEAGFQLADDAQLVVAGLDPQLTYAKLKQATLLIRAGAEFIGTNDDRTFPTAEGLAPGAGSVLAAIQTATDQKPRTMGKPNAPMFEAALAILGTDAEHTLMIGDRLETDIAGAQRVGYRTALVLTGVATADDVDQGTIKPDTIYADLDALRGDFI